MPSKTTSDKELKFNAKLLQEMKESTTILCVIQRERRFFEIYRNTTERDIHLAFVNKAVNVVSKKVQRGFDIKSFSKIHALNRTRMPFLIQCTICSLRWHY